MGAKEDELRKIEAAAGNIAAQAQHWEDAATEIDDLVTSIKNTKNDLAVDWEGQGADAAYTAMDTLTQQLVVHATALRDVKAALVKADTAVATAQTALATDVESVNTSPSRQGFMTQEGVDSPGPVGKKFDQQAYDAAVADREAQREAAADAALKQLKVDMAGATTQLPVEAPDDYSKDDTQLPTGGGGSDPGGSGGGSGYSGGNTGATPTISQVGWTGGRPLVPGYQPTPTDPMVPQIVPDDGTGIGETGYTETGLGPGGYDGSTSVDGTVTGSVPGGVHGATGAGGLGGSGGGPGGLTGSAGAVGMVAGGAGGLGGALRGGLKGAAGRAAGTLSGASGAVGGSARGSAAGRLGGTSSVPGGSRSGGGTNIVASGAGGRGSGMVPGGGSGSGSGARGTTVSGASGSGKYGVPRLDGAGAGGRGGTSLVPGGGGQSGAGAGGRGPAGSGRGGASGAGATGSTTAGGRGGASSRTGGAAQGSTGVVGAGGGGGRSGSSDQDAKDRELLTHEDEENWYDDAEASGSVWE